MATSERQKLYNQRWREKQSKIKSLCKELDRTVTALEKLPRCPACAGGILCLHTSDRKNHFESAELLRGKLHTLEH